MGVRLPSAYKGDGRLFTESALIAKVMYVSSSPEISIIGDERVL